MRERKIGWVLLWSLVLATTPLLVAPEARAGAEKEPAAASEPAAPAFKYSKRDLAESYRPHRVHGVDWYRTIGAARLRESRLRKSQGHERLIFQMRMLGPMDGPT